jgi:hypothetical protein
VREHQGQLIYEGNRRYALVRADDLEVLGDEYVMRPDLL